MVQKEKTYTPTVNFWLDTRRAKKDGTYPCKLRISNRGEKKYYIIKPVEGEPDISQMTKQRFESSYRSASPKAINLRIRNRMNAVEVKARIVIENLSFFTFGNFEAKFFQTVQKGTDIFSVYDQRIEDKKSRGAVSSYRTYEESKATIGKYLKHIDGREGTTRKFEEIDQRFLEGFEDWCRVEGLSVATIALRLRVFRAIFNHAIYEGIISADAYPFGQRKYSIPSSAGKTPKALDDAQISLIENYKPDNQIEAEAKDLWLFSFYCNGMNLADIVSLTNDQIDRDQGTINFFRSKTKGTAKAPTEINAILSQTVVRIIRMWGGRSKKPEAYVFPITSKTASAEISRDACKNKTKFVNDAMKKIAKKIGLPEDISLLWARHSFATRALKRNVPVPVISQMLGHSNIKTTQVYLDRFNIEELKKYHEIMMNNESNLKVVQGGNS